MSREPLPDDSVAQRQLSTAKAVAALVPYFGGSISEVFAAILQPQIQKRRDEWFQSIADDLDKLIEKVQGIELQKVRENEQFTTALLNASQSAIRNHSKEKLDALKNAIVNVAAGSNLEENIQQLFLTWIDTLTPFHLRMLEFFRDPREYGEKIGKSFPNWSVGGPSQVIEHAFDDVLRNRAIYDQIIKDLQQRGLIGEFSPHTTMSGNGMFASRTTELGVAFLDFIKSPVSD